MILPTIAWALLTAAFLWVVYMALEPFVRRRWPGRIISWTRLLAGDVRDPMVCRDLLIGALFGVGGLLWGVLRYQVPVWLGHPPGRPFVPDNWWLGAGSFLPFLGHQVMSSLMIGLIAIFVVLVLSLVLRRNWLAFAIGGAIVALLVFTAVRDVSVIGWIFAIGGGIFFIFRSGVLAC